MAITALTMSAMSYELIRILAHSFDRSKLPSMAKLPMPEYPLVDGHRGIRITDEGMLEGKLISMRVEFSPRKITMECADAVNERVSMVSFTVPDDVRTIDDFQRIATPFVARMYEMLTGTASGFVDIPIRPAGGATS
jgi:hypothetical protein